MESRPFKVFGEGPPDVTSSSKFNEHSQHVYTAEDIRFTQRADTVYAFALGWPAHGKLTIKTLAKGSAALPKDVQRLEVIGSGPIHFSHEPSGLKLTLPEKAPNEYAYCFVIQS